MAEQLSILVETRVIDARAKVRTRELGFASSHSCLRLESCERRANVNGADAAWPKLSGRSSDRGRSGRMAPLPDRPPPGAAIGSPGRPVSRHSADERIEPAIRSRGVV